MVLLIITLLVPLAAGARLPPEPAQEGPYPCAVPETTAQSITTAPRYYPGPGIDISPRALTSRVQGEKRPFVLLIEFDDVTASKPVSHFSNILSGMDDYYNEVSYGQLSIAGNVSGQWYTSTHVMSYYGQDSGSDHDSMNGPISNLVKEAVNLADADIDFSQYDYDSNGVVDNIIIVHSGNDQAESGAGNDIWSHKSTISGGHSVDGVSIQDYTMLAETSPLGTFVHEFTHDLGLPDLYDYGFESDGLGQWCLMAMGNYLNYGNTPVHISAWGKVQLGWVTPVVIDDIRIQQTIPAVERNPVVYKLPISAKEYFLVENRQQIDYDLFLPGRGLMIYHIDENQWPSDPFNIKHLRPNEDENHKFVDVEESTPVQNLDLGIGEGDNNTGDAADPWYGTASGFSFLSDPSSSSYAAPGANTLISVTNISAPGSSQTEMKADLAVNVRSITMNSDDQIDIGLGVGETREFTFDCTSNRKLGDSLSPVKEGANNGWAVFNTTAVPVASPADTGSFKMVLTVPKDTLSGTKASITVRLQNIEGFISNELTITVTADARFEIAFPDIPNATLYNEQMTPVKVEVRNRGNYQTALECTLAAPKDFDFEIVPDKFNLSAFDSTNITIRITPSASARGGQDYTFTLKAELAGTPGLYNTTEIRGSMNAVRGIGISFTNETRTSGLKPGQNNEMFIRIQNSGNIGEEITLAHELEEEAAGGWTLEFENTVVSIAPSLTRTVKLTVFVPLEAVYDEQGAALVITGDSSDSLLRTYLNASLGLERLYSLEMEQDRKQAEYRMDPDTQMNIGIVITNLGNVVDELDLAASAPPGLSASPELGGIGISPREEVLVNLTIKSDFDVPVGLLQVNLTASSRTNTSYSVTISITISIQPSTRLQVVLRNSLQDEDGVTHFTGGDTFLFTLEIHNVGNFIDTVKVSANITKGLGTVRFLDADGSEVDRFDMDMGEKRTLTVEIQTKPGTDVDRETVELIVTNAQGKKYTSDIVMKNDEEPASYGAAILATGVFVVLVLVALMIIIAVILTRKKKKGAQGEPAPGQGGPAPAQEDAPVDNAPGTEEKDPQADAGPPGEDDLYGYERPGETNAGAAEDGQTETLDQNPQDPHSHNLQDPHSPDQHSPDLQDPDLRDPDDGPMIQEDPMAGPNAAPVDGGTPPMENGPTGPEVEA